MMKGQNGLAFESSSFCIYRIRVAARMRLFSWRRRGDPSNGKLLGAASKPSALMVRDVVDIEKIYLIHGKASFNFLQEHCLCLCLDYIILVPLCKLPNIPNYTGTTMLPLVQLAYWYRILGCDILILNMRCSKEVKTGGKNISGSERAL